MKTRRIRCRTIVVGVIFERLSKDCVFQTSTLFNLIEEKESFWAKQTRTSVSLHMRAFHRDYVIIFVETFVPAHPRISDTVNKLVWSIAALPSCFVLKKQRGRLDSIWGSRKTEKSYDIPGNLPVKKNIRRHQDWIRENPQTGLFFLLAHLTLEKIKKSSN